MTTVMSREVVYAPGRTPDRNASANRINAARGERSTGLFTVPTGVGNPITLSVFVSNPTSRERTAQLTVVQMAEGKSRTVLFRTLNVPSGGVRKVDLDDLAGATVVVSVSPRGGELLPSVSVTEYFPADGGIIVRLAKYPGNFVDL